MFRKMLLSITIVFAFLAALTGCEFISQFFASDQASIVSFSMDGIVGTATIDPDNRTVTLAVEPMDISTVTPTVTVSENATLQMATLVDGQAATFRVTAEDGTVVTWSVTVNVQYGMSFTYASEPTHVVLTAGVVDSSDPSSNTVNGDGVPAGYAYVGGASDSTFAYAMASNFDLAAAAGPPLNYATVAFPGMTTGSFTGTESYFTYHRYVDGGAGDVYLESDYTADASFHLSVSSFRDVGGDIVGIFYGSVNDGMSAPHTLTDGFFKVRRLADTVVE